MADFFSRIAEQAATKYAYTKVPSTARPLIDVLAGKASVDSLVDVAKSGFLDKVRAKGGGIAGDAVQALLRGDTKQVFSLTGGISMRDAREMFKRAARTNYAKTNLFFISIVDLKSNGSATDINFFATAADYPAFTISSSPIQTGGAAFRGRTTYELADIRLTTLDDTSGSVKKWFVERKKRMVHGDGTFGVPMDYLMKIQITHAYAQEVRGAGVYTDEFIVQPGSMELQLTRRDDALQEVQMTLPQFDTFSNLK